MNTGFDRVAAAVERALRAPAYRMLLSEAGVEPRAPRSAEEFARFPVLEKRNTFQRFPIEQLCVDGELGPLASVLTSSGHSGVFAFGLSEAGTQAAAAKWVDGVLDGLFHVKSRRTLLINCLPMGVKIPTEVCTLGETSVRADMAVGLVQAFARSHEQTVLVGETAFIKHVLELGAAKGVSWRELLVHVIVGEEPLAENGRKYLERVLGIDHRSPTAGRVVSSMGIAELGLHLFFEAAPGLSLVGLRRALHANAQLRAAVLGDSGATYTPSLFTFDPERLWLEIDAEGRLLFTTLDPWVKIPLIRYRSGDFAAFLRIPERLRASLEAEGAKWADFSAATIVAVRGRGDCARAGSAQVFPEAVKEGIYHDSELVPLTTANFRLVSGPEFARVRVQLAPGTAPSAELDARFHAAIARYVPLAQLQVSCETYERFGSGMSLDYERKFNYLGP